MAESGKLTAAMVLGIVGGIFGILGGLLAMTVDGMDRIPMDDRDT
jgi:uncharacterized sodium:solute symporter family permease YidK